MRQVLFRIPFPGLSNGIPLYGYGVMLFIALVVCNWVAGRRAQKEGIAKERVQDLAIWLVLFGLIGARTTYLLQEKPLTLSGFISEFPRIWDGGIILYGAIIGGVFGMLLAYYFVLRRYGISTWKMADVIAPGFALAICIGRFGCLLNGCCYGSVANPDAHILLPLHFPFSAPPTYMLTEAGLQTAAGFTTTQRPDQDVRTVAAVAPASPAEQSGLKAGDVIAEVNGRKVGRGITIYYKEGEETLTEPAADFGECAKVAYNLRARGKEIVRVQDGLDDALFAEWPRGVNDVSLGVQRDGHEKALPPFEPRTLGLIPTQLYESVSMGLAFLVLTAFYPFHRRDGQVVALLMLCYGLHRFLNEQLRNDPRPTGFESYISVGLIAGAVCLSAWLWLRPAPRAAAAKQIEALHSV
jgi:phosphatidylglycerol---prolipoprotein diacylglyceryl transferase